MSGELAPPPLPPGTDAVWAAFWELRKRAGSNGLAPNPISWREIEAWCALNRVPLLPMEAQLIQDMDDAALAAYAEK